MATIDDLNLPDIADMSPDEAIEYIRQIRLARRTPVKKIKTKKAAAKKATPKINATQAANLLKLLGE